MKALLNRLIQVTSIVLAAVLLFVILNWSFLTKLKAGIDLRGFARVVRKSTLLLREKERLLDEIEHLEDRVDFEQAIDLIRWWQHAQAVDDMLNDEIEGDEVRLIERELDRSEKDLEKS
jgi:hypothetical protein